jgi:hypothetical protein
VVPLITSDFLAVRPHGCEAAGGALDQRQSYTAGQWGRTGLERSADLRGRSQVPRVSVPACALRGTGLCTRATGGLLPLLFGCQCPSE